MKDYIELALRTESTNWYDPNPRLLHAAMGLVTETVELMDSVDDRNFIEELGDVLWYVAIACNTLGISIDEAEEAAGFLEDGDDLVAAAAGILDMLKKSIFYGKPISPLWVAQRLGKIILLVQEVSQTPLDEVMAANIFKLEKRFPELKFSEDKALNRDVENELNHI